MLREARPLSPRPAIPFLIADYGFEMLSSGRQLFNAPRPELFEAVSCWLSRLALSQGTSLHELLGFFGLEQGNGLDLDKWLIGEHLGTLRSVCGLSEEAFVVHERVFTSLHSMWPTGSNYLIHGHRNKPRFRYCPLCIKVMRTPHFPIHWRFMAWRWCPEHDCLLEDACPKCHGAIVFPIDIAASKAGSMGYILLNRCQTCGSRLDAIDPCLLQVGNFRCVSRMEDLMLANGRALLAGLYYGSFQFKSQPGRCELTRLHELEKHGVLPTHLEWLAPRMVRKRPRFALYSGSPAQWMEHPTESTLQGENPPFIWKVFPNDWKT